MTHISIWLRNILSNEKTGRLVFKSGLVSKDFFFLEGRLIQFKTNQTTERLGDVLLKMGKITREDHENLEKDILPNLALGSMLVGRGVITEKDLKEALEFQMREGLLNVFSRFDADYLFHPHDPYVWNEETPAVEIAPVIERGIRHMPNHTSLQAFLEGKVFVVKNRNRVQLLSPDAIELLDRFNGKDPAESIRAESRVDPESFWKTLLILYCLDMVDVEKDAAISRPAGDFESPAPRDPVAEDVQSRMSDVLAFRDMAMKADYYRILGVSRKAEESAIKKAYFLLARKYHPDSFGPDLSSEFRSQIDDVFEAVTAAYKTLSNGERRRAYDKQMDGPTSGVEEVQDGRQRAEIKFRQGKTLYDQARYEEASILLEEAVRMNKDKGDYFLLLGLTLNRIPGQARRAEANFLKAVELEPWNPEGYVGLGYLYKKENMTIRALRHFQKAAELDPDHKAARHEADVLGSGSKKKGFKDLFSLDIFGKKK